MLPIIRSMPRPTQLLHSQREPAPLRAAATVLLLRDGADGIEVLMTRRSPTASFAPGAYVFPGGAIDPADAAAHGLAQRRAGQPELQLTQSIAAIRESFEELGILLARRADGRFADAADVAALDRAAPFAEQCRAHGLILAADAVFLLAHWSTDRDLPKRFDVPFLVARVPAGQTPVADDQEQFEPVWVRPQAALDRHAAGSFSLIFPTLRTLERIAHHATVDALLVTCVNEQPLWISCPRAGFLKGAEARFMEHESPYGELQLVCPDGQLLHPLDWQSEHPVQLLKNVQRLTAPNPGTMTGPGTNSYLVGDAATGFTAIDPGPADLEHLQRLHRAAGGDIRQIVCTHSHADHSPGAAPLAALCEAGNGRRPLILGLPSESTARKASYFVPDRTLQNGELLTLDASGLAHTLEVIFTPGHAANHLCLVLREDGLLFSGDHILNGSTTVVDPPDGNMNAYLDSLDRLLQACDQHQIEFILPAHGYVLGQARRTIERLKAHRLKREAKVIAAMRALPQGSMQQWVEQVYDDVSPRLWPMALRSLLAHVERVRELDLTAR